MTNSSTTVRSELAPTGTLRVGINLSNFLLTRTDPGTGEHGGVAVDLGRELARRLGVSAQIIAYESPGKLADAAKTGVWDVGFLGAEPQRANEIDFTAAYVEIEATYLIPPGSAIRTIADVDREGVRIAISGKSAYDLYLTRNLKHAQLVRETGADNVFKRFVEDKLDAIAGLKPRPHPRRAIHRGPAGNRHAQRPPGRFAVFARVRRRREALRPCRATHREEQRTRTHGRRTRLRLAHEVFSAQHGGGAAAGAVHQPLR